MIAKFEITIYDSAELSVAKALGATAYGYGKVALHEELQSVEEVPYPLSHESSGILLNELMQASYTRDGLDVGVSSTVAGGILRGIGIEIR